MAIGVDLRDLQVRYRFKVYIFGVGGYQPPTNNINFGSIPTGNTWEKSYTLPEPGLVGGFTKVSGLSIDIETEDWIDSAQEVYKSLPGKYKPGAVKLSRGKDYNKYLYEWMQEVRNRSHKRYNLTAYMRNVEIDILRRDGSVYQTAQLINAWPSSYDLGDLDSSSKDFLAETVELRHSGIFLS